MPMQKTVYIEKSVKFLWENNEKFSLLQNTNFMNAVSRLEYTIKQWTILINSENRFYECNKQIQIYSKQDVQMKKFY